MATTTSESISIVYTIPSGAITTYTSQRVLCDVSFGSVRKIVNNPTIINATATTAGSITFASVPTDLGEGVYRISIVDSSVDDLDSNATLTTIKSCSISKRTNTTSLTL